MGGKKVHCGKCTKEKRNFVFIFRSNFNVTRIYPRVLLKKKKKKEREKRNERKKNKKKNIVHTPSIGKNVMLHVLFYFVTLIRE